MTAPEIPGLPGIEIWEELSNIPSDDILSVKVKNKFNKSNQCRWIEYDLPTSKEELNRYRKKQWIYKTHQLIKDEHVYLSENIYTANEIV